MKYKDKNRKSSDQDFFLGNMLSEEKPSPEKPTPETETKKPRFDLKAKLAPVLKSAPLPKQKEKEVEETPFILPEAKKEEIRSPEEASALLRALSDEKAPKKEENPWDKLPEKAPMAKKDDKHDDMWNADLWKQEEEPKKTRFQDPEAKERFKERTEELREITEKTLPVVKEKIKGLPQALREAVKKAIPAAKRFAVTALPAAKAGTLRLTAKAKKYTLRLIQILKEEIEALRRKRTLAIEKKEAEKEAAEKAAKEAAEQEAIKKAEAEFRKKYNAVKTHLLTKRDTTGKENGADAKGKAPVLPKENESLDLANEKLQDYLTRTGDPDAVKKSEKRSAKPHARRDITKAPLTGAEAVKASLDGMYGVYRNPKKQKKKKLRAVDYVRYAFLFICIFGFFSAGFFVFRKLYDYYRAHVVYSGLQEMVSKKDYFAHEYLKKASISFETLTPEEILEGKKPEGEGSNATFTEEQETLVNKIAQLKKINPDTVGWISIDGTVVDYPLVWTAKRNYYLHRDFYGKSLSGGAIFMDERNDPDITKNRNTVIYGHNMADGSMFASIHDYASASVFYGTKIEIATQDGIYVYTPFSVHHSNAFDNYFETNFVSDDDFIDFCEQMAFLSLHQTDFTFTKNSQIITLSTCMDNETATEERFAVHAVLTQVIR